MLYEYELMTKMFFVISQKKVVHGYVISFKRTYISFLGNSEKISLAAPFINPVQYSCILRPPGSNNLVACRPVLYSIQRWGGPTEWHDPNVPRMEGVKKNRAACRRRQKSCADSRFTAVGVAKNLFVPNSYIICKPSFSMVLSV